LEATCDLKISVRRNTHSLWPREANPYLHFTLPEETQEEPRNISAAPLTKFQMLSNWILIVTQKLLYYILIYQQKHGIGMSSFVTPRHRELSDCGQRRRPLYMEVNCVLEDSREGRHSSLRGGRQAKKKKNTRAFFFVYRTVYILPSQSEKLDKRCMGLVFPTAYFSRNTRVLVCEAKFVIHIHGIKVVSAFSVRYMLYKVRLRCYCAKLSCINYVLLTCDTHVCYYLSFSGSHRLSHFLPLIYFSVPFPFQKLRCLMISIAIYESIR
jgi:hypothetical protein